MATDVGFYGSLRQPGDEFEIESAKHFSKRWMKKLGKAASEKPKTAEGAGAADLADMTSGID